MGMKKQMKKFLAMMLCAITVCTFVLPQNQFLSTSITANAASAKTQNRNALKAYKKLLAKKTFNWTTNGSADSANQTANYSFFCVDLNKDKVKELVLINDESYYAAGYLRVYTFKNNKVKLVYTSGNDVAFYPNKGLIVEQGQHTGYYWENYVKFEKNGKVKTVANRGGTDNKEYVPSGNKVQQINKSGAYPIYYYLYEINGSKTSYSKYKSKVKSLKKGAKACKQKSHKNTASNRSKYIK
ncbi:hypothetical protein lbkm_1163 [Lachnospiraceae bacterium KM106-2]|nr:hypothetical protein lbkm_1163 [Lachnospiraceae bacterium KM106-2]